MTTFIIVWAALATAASDCVVETTKIDRPAALAAGKKLKQYGAAMKSSLLERDQIVDILELAVLSKTHVIILGPPGNAKSKISNLYLGNIMDQPDPKHPGKPSYWTHQMTPESTISDTHGPISWKTLDTEDKYRRLLNEGILFKRTAFIDEIFDGNPKTQRNILQALNERSISEGSAVTKGILETAVVASNKYLSQVYQKAEALRDPDGPKALIDRFAFSVFVPREFGSLDSDIDIISQLDSTPKLPQVTFQELDQIRALMTVVEIPKHVASFLSLLTDRIALTLANLEQKSMGDYAEARKNGEVDIAPPYRATKYYSKRTLRAAGLILRAIVLRDWIEKDGKRELSATIEDVEKLKMFLALNGPGAQLLEAFANRSTDLNERAQYDTILRERETFETNYATLLKEVNDFTYKYAFTEIESTIAKIHDPAQREQYGKELIELLMRTVPAVNTRVAPWENTGQRVGAELLVYFLKSSLKKLLGANYEQKIEEQIKTIEREAREQAARVEAEKQAKITAEQERQRVLELRKSRMDGFKTHYAFANDHYTGNNTTLSNSWLGENIQKGANYNPITRKTLYLLPAEHKLLVASNSTVSEHKYSEQIGQAMFGSSPGSHLQVMLGDNNVAYITIENTLQVLNLGAPELTPVETILSRRQEGLVSYFHPDRKTLFTLDADSSSVRLKRWSLENATSHKLTSIDREIKMNSGRIADLLETLRSTPVLGAHPADPDKMLITKSANPSIVFELDTKAGVAREVKPEFNKLPGHDAKTSVYVGRNPLNGQLLGRAIRDITNKGSHVELFRLDPTLKPQSLGAVDLPTKDHGTTIVTPMRDDGIYLFNSRDGAVIADMETATVLTDFKQIRRVLAIFPMADDSVSVVSTAANGYQINNVKPPALPGVRRMNVNGPNGDAK